MGIFDELTGTTAADRNKLVLQRELGRRIDLWTRKPRQAGTVYRGHADLLRQRGQFFAGRVCPEEYRHLIGQPSQCFDNAKAAVEADPELRYFEGIYSSGYDHYTTHAWAVTPDDGLLEVTLPTWFDFDIGVMGGGRVKVLPPDRWGYWGVGFHIDYVNSHNNAMGLPIFDRIGYEEGRGGDTLDLTDPREEWPVLTKFYDRNRRAL